MKILVHISLSVLQTYFNKICPKYDSSMQTYNTFCVQPKGIVWRPIYDRINDGMRAILIFLFCSLMTSDIHCIVGTHCCIQSMMKQHCCQQSHEPISALSPRPVPFSISLQPLSHFIDRMDPARANGIGKRESSSLHQPMSLRAARVHTPSDKNPERALAFVHLIPARVSRIGTRTAREANIGKQGA